MSIDDVKQDSRRAFARFARKFEPHGEGFVFRRNLRAPGVLVTREERDRFVADYKTQFQNLLGATFVLAIIGILGFTVLGMSEDPPPEWTFYVALVGMASIMTGWMVWAEGAPGRATKGRPQVTPGRSAEEARRIFYGHLSWDRLVLGLASIPALLLLGSRDGNLLVGWRRAYLVVAGLGLVTIAWRSIRKLMIAPK